MCSSTFTALETGIQNGQAHRAVSNMSSYGKRQQAFYYLFIYISVLPLHNSAQSNLELKITL